MANQWQIRQGQAIHGPFTDTQLRQLFQAGRINAETSVRNGENAVWQKAGAVSELSNGSPSSDGASESIDSIVDEVLGSVTPTPSGNQPFSELPQGWEHAPPKPIPPKPVPVMPAPQKVTPSPPAKKDAETVPNYDGFQTLTGLFATLGALSLVGVFFLAVNLLGTESGLSRELAISAVVNATVQALGFVAIAAIFSGIRDALRSLRQIAISNERIAAVVRPK